MIRDRIASALRFVVLVGILVLAWMVLRVGAQDRASRSQTAQRDLALAVAKVAANEASLTELRPAEVALIWQVTEARADSSADRLRWLRAHSSCVLTDRPLRDSELGGNCRWSRNLSDSDVEPANWPTSVPWSRYVERWRQVRGLARRLVDGHGGMRPCPGTPLTWGGPMDRARALERGLVPLGCRDPRTGIPTLNEGFALRGDAT